ncbi:Yip1 family protein [Streptomyces sp. TS71-3]|uniref:Yip1 family protein n=1 Tax=Streptomyces sp. TS71-3 TaxID=2733862 RepID=UPI001AFD3644|nr:Yip1 family protein [Streptomyces sp. TS71-3]GHJ40499.1 membrane protein [Streptomyces sp. TS71-3]
MAGFRIGRGRAGRVPQAQPQSPTHPRQQPYGQAPQGQAPYGAPTAPPYAQQPGRYGYPQQQPPGAPAATPSYGRPEQWTQGRTAGGGEEPEYFGDGGGYGQGPAPDPYAADQPGHTQAFSVNEEMYRDSDTYRAGQAAAPPAGPRLPWQQLITGVVFRPRQTFLQMRDYTVWLPALIVTFVYGLLAVFGFNGAREDAIHTTLSSDVPIVLITAVTLLLSSLILGVVTHTLARQLGGDGAWQPTVGLSMLIMSLTDAPRLVFAIFMGGNASFVQVLGGVTWLGAGCLLTLMVSRSHDLPWQKALAASAIQLVAILALLKLGTF